MNLNRFPKASDPSTARFPIVPIQNWKKRNGIRLNQGDHSNIYQRNEKSLRPGTGSCSRHQSYLSSLGIIDEFLTGWWLGKPSYMTGTGQFLQAHRISAFHTLKKLHRLLDRDQAKGLR
jgi:hypothetical protein